MTTTTSLPAAPASLPARLDKLSRQWSRLRQQPLRILVLLILLAVLAAFILYPLGRILIESFRENNEWTLANYERFFGSVYFQHTLYNTVAISAIATFAAVLLGLVFAFGVTRTSMPGKNLFLLVSILPLITPPFFSAFAFILLLGRNGLVNRLLFSLFEFRIDIYGWHGVALAQALTLFPIAFLNLTAALSSIDPRLEEAAEDMGAGFGYVFRKVTLPLLTPALFSSTILILMFNVSAFGIPAILGSRNLLWPSGSMLAPEAIIQILGRGNLAMGSTLAMIMLVPSFALFLFQSWYVRRRSYITVTGMPTAFSPRPAPRGVQWGVFITCLLTSILILSLYAVIFAGALTRTWGVDYSFDTRHVEFMFNTRGDSIVNSLLLSMIGAVIASLLGVFIAYVLKRWTFPGKGAFNFIVMLPYALPGLVMGLGLAAGYNAGLIVLSGTATIILIDFAIRRMPFSVESNKSALSQVDETLEQAGADLGANWTQVFRRITLPLLRPTFFAALTFAFIRCMTDITSVIFLVSPRWRLMSIDIYNYVSAGRLGTAAAMASLMIVIIVIVLAVIWRASGLGYRLFKL